LLGRIHGPVEHGAGVSLVNDDNPRKYWSVLKTRLKRESSELATNCSQLKMLSSDGKKYLTDVANTEQILRLTMTSDSNYPLNGASA
jgi:hypothetical protein